MNGHLTERQIQEYIDGTLTDNRETAAHLESCAACCKALRQYQALFSALETPPAIALSDTFADAVMKRLPDEAILPADLERRWAARDLLAVVSGLAVMVIATFVFVGPTAMARFFTSFGGWPQLDLSGTFAPIGSQIERMNINPTLVLFAVITLVGILAADRAIVAYRRHARGRIFHMI